MSPEQAAGKHDQMGPVSDVYSLGATLYQLLTGRGPFSGEELAGILNKVERGDFRPPGQVKPLVPSVLEAVCLKAMALKPQDRYASAQELAREIERWLADEPVRAYREPALARLGRWGRRHRALVASMAVLLATASVGFGIGLWAVGIEQQHTAQQRDRAEENLGALATEQERTSLQRDLAEENLRQARRAVDECFLLARDHPLLQRANLSPVRRLLFSRALPFYERFRVQHPEDSEVQSELAENYHRVGYITSQIGRESDALDAFQHARDAWTRLAQEHPAQTKYQVEVARNWNNLGIVLLDTRKSAEARAAFDQALGILDQVLVHSPQDEDYQVIWARTYNNLGNLHRSTSKLDEALAAYQKAQDVWDRLVTQHPDNRQDRSDQASTCFNRANLYARKGQWMKSQAAFEQARSGQQQLAAEYPDIPQHRADLARTCTNLGNLFHITGRPDEALTSYHQAQALGERLVLEQPEVAQYRAELIKACMNSGLVHRDRGQWVKAALASEQVQDNQRRLVEGHPDVPEYRADLATTRTNLGSFYLKLDRSADALASYQQADADWQQLVTMHPDILEFKMNNGALKGNIGDLLRQSGKFKDSLPWLDKAIALLSEVRTREPNNPTAREYLFNTLRCRAEALGRVGRREDALRDWDSALELAPPVRQVVVRAGRLATQVRATYSPRLLSEVAQLASMPKLPGDTLYSLATAYALAARAVRQDTQMPAGERDSLAEQYVTAALDLLARARAAEWFSNPAAVRRLKEDADFAPLKDHAGWRKLLEELEKGR
jgi:serine/threonine-protein kinase